MKKIIIICSIVIVLLLGIISWQILHSNRTNNQAFLNLEQKQQFHYAYFMQDSFYTGILKPDAVTPIEDQVYGGIVSHHFFVEREIAKLFSSWSKQKFKTIVLVGPNHFSVGSADMAVSQLAYKTPWGALEPDAELINQLIRSGLVKANEEPFEREHSISVLVGFIKHQFPDVKVVSIIVKRNTSAERIQQLSEKLNQILPQDSLVLASVDFSHHVDNKTAKTQDEKSIQFLKNFDVSSLDKSTSTQIDSPASLGVLLKYLGLRQAKKMQFWNTNQALYSGNLDSQDVTSYVFASFTK